MRFAFIPWKVVRVLMVLVVRMQVLVLHQLVHVLMLVVLADVQPDAQCHQAARNPEAESWHFAQQHQR